LAYAQALRRRGDVAYMGPLVARALAFADTAVARDSTSQSVGMRGTVRMAQVVANLLATDPGAREAQERAAQRDLETATRMDPTNADAWAALSVLYVRTKTLLDVKLAATRAYEADPYLAGADRLLFRLFSISYDLAQFADARRYCAEMARRFPTVPSRPQCELELMSVPDAPAPAPARAWALASEVERASPAGNRDAFGRRARLYVAAALARAGLRDSARRVVDAALEMPNGALRDDLAPAGAWVRLLSGDRAGAFTLLKGATDAGRPLSRQQALSFDMWWWRDVRDDPEWRVLQGT
ncbi:MAG TPA: hypothetical protein VGD56_17760, partial [Gemmatirosa sp.]